MNNWPGILLSVLLLLFNSLLLLQAREKGVPATPIERQKRVGLGKVGPLRFRSTKQSLARAVAADSEAPEQDAKSAGEAGQAAASPPAAAAGDAGDAQSQ